MKRWFFLLLFLVSACGPALRTAPPTPGPSSAGLAQGVVFEDRDGNGVRDEGERAVAGVKVSNGVEVVVTDQEGRYALPVSDDTTIFVIKPRDWGMPLNRHHLPLFYYIHKPLGSPDERYLFKGVPPTGPLPRSIDFPPTICTLVAGGFSTQPTPTRPRPIRRWSRSRPTASCWPTTACPTAGCRSRPSRTSAAVSWRSTRSSRSRPTPSSRRSERIYVLELDVERG